MKRNVIIFNLFFIIFSSLGVKAQDENFTFRDGNKSVKLEFENGLSFLEINKPTKVKVIVENINLKESSIIGCGISVSGDRGEDFFTCNITVVDSCVKDKDYLEISIYYRHRKERKLLHKFSIPIKK